jgi:phosphatidylserine decarboxylase
MFEVMLWGILLALLTTLPLAWKWQLGVFRVACVIVALGVAASFLVLPVGGALAMGMTARSLLVWVLTMVAATSILLYRFFRDPERVAPNEDNVIVSPADGVVIYVLPSEQGMLPVSTKKGRKYSLVELTKTPLREKDAVVIGISMSFLDVHVNRAPIRGRVTLQRHFPGQFGSLRQAEMVFENERATTVIEGAKVQLAVVQIASRLVRQIVPFIREGQEVTLGQRIGLIRFGSQVDLVLPARKDLCIEVKPGQRLRAGESVIAKLT